MADRIMLSKPQIAGGNWMKVMAWMRAAFSRAGFDVDMSTPGAEGVVDAMRQLARGEIHATISLTCAAWQAAHSSGIYRGETLPVRGLALTVHAGHNFFNFVRREVGVQHFADLPRVKPALRLCAPSTGVIVGEIVRSYLHHYGIDLDRDIPRWGGEIFPSFPQVPRLFVEGRANALMRENTRMNPAGIVADLYDVVCLSMDRDIADLIAREYGTPVVVMPPGTLRGQTEPVVTVSNAGYPILVHKDVPDDLVYRMAKALNESSESHAVSEDIFYSVRHAPETGAPLHPGAERYYREHHAIS